MGFSYNPKKGGVYNDTLHFVPGPGTIFRRKVLLDIMEQLPSVLKGNYLGIGCGTAALDYEFFRAGYNCTVTDWSNDALINVEKIYNEKEDVFKCKRALDKSDSNFYDVLAAYEVLEHAQNDELMVQEWKMYLKKGGTIILSVPAHMKYWSFADEAAGHYRRYEKDELTSLLEKCGFEEIRVVSMGFPFLVMLLPLSRSIQHKPLQRKNRYASKEIKTKETGLISSRLYKLRHLIPFRLITVLSKTQKLFYNTDFAYGYVIAARKK